MFILFGWHTWRGETGKTYRFNITLTKRGMPEGGGVYIFVRRRFIFWLQPLYVGKATTFTSRLIGHEKWWHAWWYEGATERHLLRIDGTQNRARVEEDLIRSLKPKMNFMLIARGKDDAPRDKRLAKSWRRRRWFMKLLPWGN